MSIPDDSQLPSPAISLVGGDDNKFIENGLYIEGDFSRIERIEDYTEGGHHPIHLDDCLGNRNQYQVINKLGNGGYANVWLCNVIDAEPSEYVAVKILMARVSGDDCSERATVSRLQQIARDNPTVTRFVCLPVDQFWLEGPNGSHQCFVYPLAGPQIAPLRKAVDNPNKFLRDIICQCTEAMALLHRPGICHGDFRPPNILLRSANRNGMTEDELLDYFDDPLSADVVTRSGGSHSDPHAPQYLIYPIEYYHENSSRASEDICIIDFGEAFDKAHPPKEVGIPLPYAVIETLFGERPSPKSDIWALACTIFEIRMGQRLFALFDNSKDDYLSHIADLFGQFPEAWWSTRENRTQFFPDEPRENEMEPRTLRGLLRRRVLHSYFTDSGSTKVFHVPEDELQLFADLLEKMFEYDVDKRLSADEVLQHPWFKYAAEHT